MANESMTVEQACEKLQDQSLYNDSIEDDAWAIITDMCSKILATHKQELAAKDAEIARLKACRDGNCERIRLGAEPCEGCHVQVANDEITKLRAKRNELYDCNLKLRALVNELEDALNSAKEEFESHKNNEFDDDQVVAYCNESIDRINALVAKAREVCK